MASDQASPNSPTVHDSKPSNEGPIDVSEGESWYQIKWILLKSKTVPILVQNQNGPCPLIALCNVLFVRGVVNLKSGLEIISSEALLQLLMNQMLESAPQNLSEGDRLNYQQNIQDSITILPKLQTGLDLNVKFHKVNGYEFTDTVGIFDLLQVNLYHGWIVDPECAVYQHTVGEKTYNQLVEMIISDKDSHDPDKSTTATSAAEFLEESANQLTFQGLIELHRTLLEEELCVFFRNNHFSTIYRRAGKLYLLVTDYGFLNESRFVWEALDSVDGDSQFFDASFNLVSTSDSQASVFKETLPASKPDEAPNPLAESPSAPPQRESEATQDSSERYNAELAEKLVREAQLREDEALAWKMMSEEPSPPPLPLPPDGAPAHPILTGSDAATGAAGTHAHSGDTAWEERVQQQNQEQTNLRQGRTYRNEEPDDGNVCSLL